VLVAWARIARWWWLLLESLGAELPTGPPPDVAVEAVTFHDLKARCVTWAACGATTR
jgi:hypothetical protein